MEIVFRGDKAPWQGPLLCITHSDRPVHTDGCGLNELEARYASPDRLPPKTPFVDLAPAANASPWKGSVTVWRLPADFRGKPTLLLHLHSQVYKPQHAIYHRGSLWILGTEVLEVFDPLQGGVGIVTDPWMAGGHTVLPGNRGNLLVSCAASDAVLEVDPTALEVTAAHRLPASHYGFNYALQRSDSVVDHFIHNDLQLTHVNCAAPWRHGIVVSTLIQGAIGWFEGDGGYRELTRGFVGCHGIRPLNDELLYFCDSCLGTVNYLRPNGAIERRIDFDSVWLHDAQHLDSQFLAICAADRNTVEIFDLQSREIVNVIDGSRFGASTQFVFYGS